MVSHKAILFDLDGTLLDTARDLANALNHVLSLENKPPLSFDLIRPVASNGARGLLELGFGQNQTEEEFECRRDLLLSYYENHIADETVLFKGMNEVLTLLEHHKIPWGIVTNKPEKLTYHLLEKCSLLARAACVIGGDTLPNRKPHPEPLIHAANLLSLSPVDCIYIGDAKRDIDSAKAANMYSVVALYGYIHQNEDPTLWNADKMIKHPEEICHLVLSMA